MEYITLTEFINHRAELTPEHLQSFKNLLSEGVRDSYEKSAVENITLELIRSKTEPQFCYTRVWFYPSGSCLFMCGQDYEIELENLRNYMLS